jgi:hypothetical protein
MPDDEEVWEDLELVSASASESPPAKSAAPEAEQSLDDIPDWLTDSGSAAQRPLGPYQFSLLGIAGLMTVCGAYFALERWHGGGLGLGMLIAMSLAAAVLLPAIWVIMWIARTLTEGSVLGMLLWLTLAIAGAMFAFGWLVGF